MAANCFVSGGRAIGNDNRCIQSQCEIAVESTITWRNRRQIEAVAFLVR